MNLQEMSIKELLVLHNSLVDTPAGLKSFATKSKLIARIESIAAAKKTALTSLRQPKSVSAGEQNIQRQTEDIDTSDVSLEVKKTPTGRGIGRLARELLLDPAGYPHAIIAEKVNARIEGAQATAKSVRWYACHMRKTGTDVPPRKNAQRSKMSPMLSNSAAVIPEVSNAPATGSLPS